MSSAQRLTLLDLPPELRERIYIFSGIVASEPLSFSATTYQHPLSQVNHLIREEVLQLYYSRNRFALATHLHLKESLEAIGDRNVSRIRRLRFNGSLVALLNFAKMVSVDITLWPARPWLTVKASCLATEVSSNVRRRLTILEMGMTTQIRKALGRPPLLRRLDKNLVTGLVRAWHKLLSLLENISKFMDRELLFEFKDEGDFSDDSDDLRNESEDFGSKRDIGNEDDNFENKGELGDEQHELELEIEDDDVEDDHDDPEDEPDYLEMEVSSSGDEDDDPTDEDLTNEDFDPYYTEGGRVKIFLDVETGIKVVGGVFGHGGETTTAKSMKMNSLDFACLNWSFSSKRPQVVLL